MPFPTSWSPNLLAVLPLLPPSQQQPPWAGVFIWSSPSAASSPLADKSFAKERTWTDFSYGTAAFNMQVLLMWVDTLLPAQLLQLDPKRWTHPKSLCHLSTSYSFQHKDLWNSGTAHTQLAPNKHGSYKFTFIILGQLFHSLLFQWITSRAEFSRWMEFSPA